MGRVLLKKGHEERTQLRSRDDKRAMKTKRARSDQDQTFPPFQAGIDSSGKEEEGGTQKTHGESNAKAAAATAAFSFQANPLKSLAVNVLHLDGKLVAD